MKVVLRAEARSVIETTSASARKVETGGPLFGFETLEGNLEIIAAYGPGAKAKQGAASLHPDRTQIQDLIDEFFAEDQGKTRYLGEWHTHPNGAASPSSRDRATLREISEQEQVLLPRPLALIQSTRSSRRKTELRDLRAFVWIPETKGVSELPLEDADRG